MRCSWLGVLLMAALANTQQTYKLCVLPQTPSYHSSAQICDKLGSTAIRCVTGVDRLDCMNKIITGDADFAVFEAEDILIAANNKHLSDILITHRIHASEDKKWEFAVVAVVSNKANITKLSELKTKKLCHPGNDPFASNYDWNEVFSLYFENRVAPQNCEKELSVEENRIRALAEFFGESCKPGVWAADPDIDLKLKHKYKSLCGLCEVPSVCSQRDKYWGRQGALYCLSDCLGDIAWSMLKDAKLHFSNTGVTVCSDVSLLCPDGSTMPLNSTEPCAWVTRPVPVIAAKRIKAEAIQRTLKELLVMPDIPDDFIRLIESNTFTPPRKLTPSITPHDYLATAPGYLSANSMSTCGQDTRAVSLCVSSLEEKLKCDWLAVVAQVYGVQPSLNCMYGANCLISVANKSADVTITTTDKLLPALKNHNLKPLLVHSPKQFKKSKTVSAVIKSSSKIKKFSELEGKKACFPTVDGIGWTSFVVYLQRNDGYNKICPYTKAMSKYFSDICISEPSPSVGEYSNIKVCSAEYSSDTWSDVGEYHYDNEAVAFQCLAVGGGDVAFISTEAIPKYLNEMRNNPEMEGLSADSFKALCEESSTDSDCHLSWASYSQVMVHEKISPAEEEDVRALFTGLNNLFGHHNTPSTRTFNMFAPANTLFDDVVSLDATVIQQQLEQFDDFLKRAKSRPKNYEISAHTMKKCSPSSSSLTSSTQIHFIFPVLFVIFTSHMLF